MNKILAMCSISAVAMLTACTGPYHGERASVGVQYDGYYDGHYGPYSGGYWNNDGSFYYSDGHGGYQRDTDHHYRREHFENGSPFHADHHD